VANATVLNPEANPTPRRRRSFHRRYRKRILAGRILLTAAIAVGVFAIPHFAYNAFSASSCYTANADDEGRRTPVESPECAALLGNTEEQMRLDAGIALLGVAFLLSSVVCYRRARRYKPRAPIRPQRPN
jgi:hypothetical protein